jgi:hypothetical protein
MLQARAAAKRLNYAPDYVSKLCREGKLDCIQIGGPWYVQRNSLAAFQTLRASDKAARVFELSQLRRRELNPPVPTMIQRPASALLPTILLFMIILMCMTLSILVLKIPIR